MKLNRLTWLCGVGAVGVMGSVALGHPGHPAGGFAAGAVHPLTGLDHLLTMLGVGMWSAQAQRRRWVMPAAFLACMAVGAGIGTAGPVGGVPGVEQVIAASLLVVGLALAGALRMPTGVCVGLASLFALFHGYAHGVEMQGGMSAAGYGSGLLMTTLLLLGIGMGVGQVAKALERPRILRVAGVLCSMVAILMLGGAL